MGLIQAEITFKNAADVSNVQRGIIAETKVRHKAVNKRFNMKKITLFVMVTLLCFFTRCKEADLELPGTIHIEPTGTIMLDENTMLTAVYSGKESVSYQWNRNNAAVGRKTTNNNFIPSRAGAYTVTVSASGYLSKKSAAVTVLDRKSVV